jgi:ribosomal protein L29
MAAEKRSKERLADLRATGDSDLIKVIREAQKRIYLFHKDKVSKPQQDVKVVHNARKEIARVLTINRERELQAEKK